MKLLEMNVSAGVLILIAALLRNGRLLKLSKRTVMMLWGIVLARLMLPFNLPVQKGIASPVFSLMQKLSRSLKEETGYGGKGMMDGVRPKAASFGCTLGESTAKQALWWIWIAGMAGLGIYFLVCFLREYCRLMQAIPLESLPETIEENVAAVSENTPEPGQKKLSVRDDGTQLLEACAAACRLTGVRKHNDRVKLWIHDRIKSPVVFGVMRQRIVFPKNLTGLEQDQMQYVLTHEMIHIKRRDNLWKLLSAAVLCIHWYNPLVWLMYLLFSRDMELACDERVLSLYGSQGREEYAMTLLSLVQNQKETTLFCSGFLENPVKERVVAIMNYKKLSGTGILCAGIILLGASSVFATNVNAQDAGKEVPGNIQESMENTAADADEEELVDYTIVKTEDGEEEAEYNGKAKIIETDGDVIYLIIRDEDGNPLEVGGTDGMVYDVKGDDYHFKIAVKESTSQNEDGQEALMDIIVSEDGDNEEE